MGSRCRRLWTNRQTPARYKPRAGDEPSSGQWTRSLRSHWPRRFVSSAAILWGLRPMPRLRPLVPSCEEAREGPRIACWSSQLAAGRTCGRLVAPCEDVADAEDFDTCVPSSSRPDLALLFG